MKDMLLFSLLTLLCTACAASNVEESPGFNYSDSDYVDLESSFLAEAPINRHVRDLALACAFGSPGGINRMAEREEEHEAGEEGIEEPEEEEESLLHELSGVIGYTTERGHGGLTLGIDYGYAITEKLDIGGVVEFVYGNINVGVIAVMGTYHPTEALYLAVGPGVEVDRDETSLLLRIGAGYDIEIDKIITGPAIYFDWVERGPEDKDDNAFLFAWRIGTRF